MQRTRSYSIILFFALLLLAALERGEAAPPNFTRDIQPIFAEKCYQCHGPDAAARKAELRWDQMDDAIAKGEIIPGNPTASPLIARIQSADDRLRMPPSKSNKVLTDREKGLLADWVASGAKHAAHWAFLPIVKPPIPDAGADGSSVSVIDAFILSRLKREGLTPARETGRDVLLRRLSFDLTGLPPAIEELNDFLADASPDYYEKAVDRLLASPRFGERMAANWLDVARYADTFGYQNDREMHVWPWRDWVIQAYNQNMPYDEFITEQLAGDLMEKPTAKQKLATAFNRLHRQTNEGGSVEEEFRLEYVADRTEVLGTATLGLTLECARCHDHKFDPTSQKEFYQLSAFFCSIDESGQYSHFTETAPTPAMMLFEPGQLEALARFKLKVGARIAAMKSADQIGTYRFLKWAAKPERSLPIRKPLIQLSFDAPPDGGKIPNDADPAAPASVSGPYVAEDSPWGKAAVFDGDNSVAVEKLGNFERSDPFTICMRLLATVREPRMVLCHRSEAALDAASRGYELRLDDGHAVFGLIHFWPGDALCVRTAEPIPTGQWVHLAASYDGSSAPSGVKIYVNGKSVPLEILRDGLYRTIRYGSGATPALRLGARFRDNGFKGGRLDDFRVYDSELSAVEIESLASGVPADDLIAAAFKRPAGAPANVMEARSAYMMAVDEPLAKLREELRSARTEEAQFTETIPQIMVMKELLQPRQTHVLGRGNYLDKKEAVTPETPKFLPPFPDGAPRNRLGLAKWLFLPEHPLTARVAVNRLWAQLFGRGLVPTPEDFGVQGESPVYPELLDYLAVRYRELKWDTKGILREMVLSSAYRRSSEASSETIRRDPENALLARGSRHRLAAEEIRDAALAASGLLSPRIGGPSVKPYQPEGIWKDSSGVEYVQDKGESLYRRSVYTFLKRTTPPPSMLIFDSTSRETCLARRERTETPLQALELLNDPQFVEAARALAQRALACNHGDDAPAAGMIFQSLTSRRASQQQMEILLTAQKEQKEWFSTHAEQAAAYLKTGESPVDAGQDAVQLAAMTAIAQLVMNYDEFQMDH